MFVGLMQFHKGDGGQNDLVRRLKMLPSPDARTIGPFVWSDALVALHSVPTGIRSLDEFPQPFMNKEGSILVVFEGKIHNSRELKQELGAAHYFQSPHTGEVLIPLYEKYGDGFASKLNGKFALALWDAKSRKLLLCRDHFGIEPLYYAENKNLLCFGNSLRAMVHSGLINQELNHDALMQYLLYCYNPSNETFLKGVHKLPAGHTLRQNSSSRTLKAYWHLSFAEQRTRTKDEYRQEILHLIADAIRIRLEAQELPGILLSGGTDSSTLVSLSSRIMERPFHTFSFRCKGKSFDESNFARLVAERYGTYHNEVLYNADKLALIADAALYMDEPFCDVGIEIGTFLLGTAAQGKVCYTLSGEGGDELFGGHPVYIADKVARLTGYIPGPIRRPLTELLKIVPDSDQKKNLQVKLKRFAYGLSFPQELLSHRWRIYYTPKQLRRLCTEYLIDQYPPEKLYDPIACLNRGADGKDILSRSLYSDYFTLVDFYLRRLGLLRAFAIEDRLPLLDVRLVEYAAKVPSNLKIAGFSDTKHIYREILEGVLPREILHDRPKLGHSVPLKNWLREDPRALTMMQEVLRNGSFERRGLFKQAFVERMLKEHLHKSDNHSHRLWALTVLELWLQTWFDA